MRIRPALLVGALIVAAFGAAAAGVAAHAGATAKVVKVTAREYHISLSSSKLAPGAVTLVVRNAGKVGHRIEITGPGVSKKTPLLVPGAKATLHVTLKAGAYHLWCTVPGHAALGMKAALTGLGVPPASSGGSSSGGSTTTTSGGGGDNGWG
jgi:plastocyanin